MSGLRTERDETVGGELVKRLERFTAALVSGEIEMPKGPPPGLKSQPQPVDGLRTERVTLEVTHCSTKSIRDLAGRDVRGWLEAFSASVRVVHEGTAWYWESEAKRLAAERDAALRERDAAKEECERLREQVVIRCTTASNLHGVIRERDQKIVTLEDRVAELEDAPAANAGGVSNPEPISGAGKPNHPEKLDSWQEPVAWGVRTEWGQFRAGLYTSLRAHANLERGDEVVPLYAAPVAESATTPQPPRGWLTDEEREALESARLHLSNSDGLDEATERECEWASDVVRRLLARSTPPLVRRPKVFQTHEFSAAVLGVMELRDREWIAAIREAGGEVG